MINDSALIESEILKSDSSFFLSYLRWTCHSEELLDQAESKLFSKIKVAFKRFHVDLGKCVGSNDKIWTCSLNSDSPNTPIILLHGFGAGMAFWAMNLEGLSADHPVYAIDTLGFARSSRPNFSNDPSEIEQQFIDSIERWREVMGIKSMVLLGHSFGGYLAGSYSLKYPDRIEHLILVDPFGFDEGPDLNEYPLWKLSVAYAVRLMFGPFSIIRAFGPFGDWLIRNVRPDLLQKYETITDKNTVASYIHHCNNKNPTGEIGFHKMTIVGPWPINTIGERMRKSIHDDVPITFLYGATSWIKNSYGKIIKEARPKSFTDVKIVENSGHHIYTDNAVAFNKLVLNACGILQSKLKKEI